MSFLKTFRYGDALTEIFFEGHNPYALQKLDTADVDAFRQHMYSDETVHGYVIGRIVGSGRGVWAVTDRSVLFIRSDLKGAQSLPCQEVQAFEAVRGRFGHTVRIQSQDRTWSLYGVDMGLAAELHKFFVSRGIPSEFDQRPARAHQWQHSATAGWVQDCVKDAQLRLGSSVIPQQKPMTAQQSSLAV